MQLKDKVVFVTGSSIGIGRETVKLFAKEGAKVVITYNHHKKDSEVVAKECIEFGAADVFVTQLNVWDNPSILKAVETTIAHFEEISILVNNAGVVVWSPLEKQSFFEIENQIRTNIEGTIKMSRACLPYLKNMIINMGSGAGYSGYPGLAPYVATKWAVRGFTKALAGELKNISVYCVNPGTTATQMNDFHGDSPEKVAEIIVNLAKGEYNLPSGSDVDVWNY